MSVDNETIRPRYGELLTAHEALELTYRFRACLDQDVLFAQVLLRYLTPEDLTVFESYMGITEHLFANPKSDQEKQQFEYISAVSRTTVGRSRSTIQVMGAHDKIDRFNRIRKTSLNRGKGNERNWGGSRI